MAIPPNAAQLGKTPYYLTDKEADYFGMKDDNNKPAFVVLKYYQPNYQCLSTWNTKQLKQFSKFIRIINSTTWTDIIRSGGKSGSKTGLGYTPHKNKAVLPDKGLISILSPEISFFELRVTEESRVHGFRMKSGFFLVWLDKDHKIYPAK